MSHNLIVNYLPQNMTDEELYSMFVTIGPIKNCKVMKDFNTGYSFGFGFVNYTCPEDAERAIQKLNGQEIFHKRIKVSYARPSSDQIKCTNLYVTNLPQNFTEEDLQILFSRFGTIIQKNLLLDKLTRIPRGIAFVRFNKREEAQEAIRNLNGVILDGATDQLNVRVAEDYSKAKVAFYAGWKAGIHQGVKQPVPMLRNLLEIPQRPGGRFEGDRSGVFRGSGERVSEFGGMHRGRNSNNHFDFIYPNRMTACFGPVRQEKLQQRYSPISFRLPKSRYDYF